jgi:hypothetical protein
VDGRERRGSRRHGIQSTTPARPDVPTGRSHASAGRSRGSIAVRRPRGDAAGGPNSGRKASIAFFPRRCGTRDDAVLGRCDAHLNALASATLGLLLLVLLGDLGSLTADLLNEWDGTGRRRVSPCCAAHSRTGRARSGRRSTRDATRDAWVGEATRTLPARASEP